MLFILDEAVDLSLLCRPRFARDRGAAASDRQGDCVPVWFVGLLRNGDDHLLSPSVQYRTFSCACTSTSYGFSPVTGSLSPRANVEPLYSCKVTPWVSVTQSGVSAGPRKASRRVSGVFTWT